MFLAGGFFQLWPQFFSMLIGNQVSTQMGSSAPYLYDFPSAHPAFLAVRGLMMTWWLPSPLSLFVCLSLFFAIWHTCLLLLLLFVSIVLQFPFPSDQFHPSWRANEVLCKWVRALFILPICNIASIHTVSFQCFFWHCLISEEPITQVL